MITVAQLPAKTEERRPGDISEQLHDLRTPLNQIIGLSEMLMEIAEEDGCSGPFSELVGIREGGVEIAGVLEENRIVSAEAPFEPGFQSLAEATHVAAEHVLGITAGILDGRGADLPAEYRDDVNKIRHAVLRFMELAVGSNLYVPARALIPTSPTLGANRSSTVRVATGQSRVLIVDDEDLNVEVLCRRLQREGYRPTGVSSGPEALDLLRSCEFDAILLDLLMPGMSGLDVLHLLKQHAQLRHIPVIMLSALSDVERVAQCIELGAEDYLPKPINSTLLRARLGACLEKKQLRDKEQAYFRAIHAEKERLSVMLRSLADAVITTDAAGRITLFNEVACSLASCECEAATGRPFEEVFRIVKRSTGLPVSSPLAEALLRNAPFDYEPGLGMTAADGRERIVSVRSVPMHDQEGAVSGAVIVIRDITDKERMAGELQRAAKLQSIGLLASGLAHQYNNMLTAVLGNLSVLQHRWAIPPEAMVSIREAEQGACRATELTRSLLTFADGGAPIREVLRLGPFVVETCNSITRGTRTSCFWDLPSDLWEIEADPGQIGQVLVSIITNSAEAMPEGGLVCVDATNVHAPLVSAPGLPQGAYVQIRVQDHGCGISQENLPHVCDPFFTTKEHARGLGLSAAYSIVQRHGGQLFIESSVGRGTTVVCYLPARMTDEAVSSPRVVDSGTKTAAPVQDGLTRGECSHKPRVLVMDDEESIRLLVETMLELLDYEVVTTSCGEEALLAHEQALAEGRPFEFAIMDLMVPGGMGGAEAMRRIRERDSAIRTIVASGYSDDPVMADCIRYGFDGILPKPYLMADLAAALAQVARMRMRAAA